MKVKEHIMSFIKNRVAIGNKYLYTHEISELANAGLMRFGRRLGDYGTYNRIFRKLREEGYLHVRRVENSKSREARWEIRGVYA